MCIHIHTYINTHSRVYFLTSVVNNAIILNKLPTTCIFSLTIGADIPLFQYKQV